MGKMQSRLGAGPELQERHPSSQCRRHIQMRRVLLDAHPEAAALSGPDHRGVYAGIVLLAIHWTVCWWVAQTGILVAFLTAFCFGRRTAA